MPTPPESSTTGYAEDVEVATSELVGNAIAHVDASSFGLEPPRLEDSQTLTIFNFWGYRGA